MECILEKIEPGVGDRIRKVRESAKEEHGEFAAQIGVGKRYIYMLEKGDRQPSQPLLLAIAYRYGIGEYWLRTGTGKFRVRG